MSAPRDLGAVHELLKTATLGLSADELREVAEREGRPVSAVAIERFRAKFYNPADSQSISSGAWRETPLMVRQVLCIMGLPGHPSPERAALQSWGSLSEADRRAIGAYSRWLRRGLDHAGALR